MAEIKGVQLKGALTFLKEQYGEEAVNAAIGKLGEEDRALLPPVFFDSNWYPYDTWRSLRRIAGMLRTGKEAPDLAVTYGKHIAQYLLNGVYRSLVAKDAAKQVGRFSAIHDFFYRDTSTLEVKLLNNSSCMVRYLYDYDVKPVPSTCLSTMGFWMRVLELSGASSVRATHPRCVCKDEESCEFEYEWR
jgi:hypothetical protein